MNVTTRIHITEGDLVEVRGESDVSMRAHLRLTGIGTISELFLGATDMEIVGNCDRLIAALEECRAPALARLFRDEATVILRTGLDSPFGAGETVEASRG